MADDRLYRAMMKKAISLAKRGRGTTTPNPLVGAVIFNHDGIIATGYHKRAGGPHAEIEALDRAGGKARGASIAVNLEPCCHHGRTGPCTEALIEAGIKEVIYAIEDPNLRVCGRGCSLLQRNNIKVVSGVMAHEAERLNEVYLKYMTTNIPFVVLKTAQSVDGRIATSTGESQWISSEDSLKYAHKLRSWYDAIAVGAGTVRADNPALTVRRVRGENPIRIILTTSDDLPHDFKLFSENVDHNTIVATTNEVIKKGVYKGTITWKVKKTREGLDLKDLIERAGWQGVSSILFEGGGRLATSLLKHKLVDKLLVVLAPMVIGKGVEAVADLGIKKLENAIRFHEYGFRKIGTDLLFWGYPKR